MKLIREDKKIEPYYRLLITLEDKYALEQKICVEYNKKIINDNFNEFKDFIKFLTVCHYSPSYNNNGYNHINNYCYFINSCDCKCLKYYNVEDKIHLKSIFREFWESQRHRYKIEDDSDHVIRYIKMELFYIDKYNCKHNIKIQFDENEISDIVEEIKKSSVDSGIVTMDSEEQPGLKLSKFMDSDPGIFLETYFSTISGEIIEIDEPLSYGDYLKLLNKVGIY
jgi:hypothetical protein